MATQPPALSSPTTGTFTKGSSSTPSPELKSKSSPSSWLKRLSRFQLASLLITYLFILHLLGLFWFSKGFLLTRITLPNVSTPYESVHSTPIPPTHKKAIIILIDALRTDFIVPPPSDSPYYNPFFHGALTLPSELSASEPSHSLLFNAYSDPPTTTMQRLKGLTTGSLPTFIEAGFNFASSEIIEDNLIAQLRSHGKRIGFMGDDTWKNLFPMLFEENMSWPFDSFNVEDLHSVDRGVMGHMMALLDTTNQTKWDVLIGHCLGVDHVGHRLGPSSPVMSTKLKEMDTWLREVVAEMDEETLLVVLGDHGMNSKGDHGGDTELETTAAMWFYSKGRALTDLELMESNGLKEIRPEGRVLGQDPISRNINQIDLVPTLALALGVPIPFNNLGSIIPELFVANGGEEGTATLEKAMRQNAQQIRTYIDSYSGDIGRERLDEKWRVAEARVREGSGGVVRDMDNLSSILAHRDFTTETLGHLRARWAQFSLSEMMIGLILLGLSVPTALALYTGVRNTRTGWTTYVSEALDIAIRAGSLGGSVVGTLVGIYTRSPGMALLLTATAGGAISELAIIAPLLPAIRRTIWNATIARPSLVVLAGPLILLAHSMAFGANSFILWEDSMVNFFLASLLLLPGIKALSATMPRLRIRILAFTLLAASLARMIGTFTICREEQQPFCRVTFYAGEGTPIPASWLLSGALGCAWYLPVALNMFLGISKSDAGPAPIFLQGLRGQLVGGGLYWTLEWLEGYSGLRQAQIPSVKTAKAWLARVVIGLTMGAGSFIWSIMPLCINVSRQTQQDNGKTETIVLGFANSYGSSYLMFLLLSFTMSFLVSQPAGQIALVASLVLILAYLEVVDAQRDSRAIARSFSGVGQAAEFDGDSNITIQPTFTEVAVFAVLGHVIFFATGHQAVLSSIQWKAAFVGVFEVVMPYSPALVVLNTWTGFLLVAIALPLLTCWNVSPKQGSGSSGENGSPILADALQSSLGLVTYFSTLTFTCALSTAWLRRHLMVWNVFAPRFMLSGVTLLVIDLGLLLGLGVGLRIVINKVNFTYKIETS